MLQLEGISVHFGGLVAVDNVSLSVKKNEVVGLVGPNGAGKTTLFNAVSGFVRPSGGRITFNSANVLRAPIYRRARIGIGRTFQIPQPMHELTVRENLVVAQRFSTGKVEEHKISEVLEVTNLSAKSNCDAAAELTLAELKALEVAKALSIDPKLLLLDEVLAGLESNNKRRFMGMLKELHKKFSLSMLVIEHDIETISNLCERVAVLNFGKLIANGTPDEVFCDPAVMESYTGVSHT